MPKSFLTQVDVPDFVAHYAADGTIYAQGDETLRTAEREFQVFVGGKTPGWLAFKKANGYLPTTNCERRHSKAKATSVEVMYLAGGRPQEYRRVSMVGNYQVVDENHTLDNPDSPAFGLDQVVASKLRRQLLDQDFNAGTSFAEADKAFVMILQTAKKVARSFSHIKTGHFLLAAQDLGMGTQPHRLPKVGDPSKFGGPHAVWLEYSFGWRPLIKDVHDGAIALARAMQPNGGKDVHRVRVQETVSCAYNTPTQRGNVQVQAKAWCLFRIPNPSIDTINRLGLCNPLAIAWEVLPFSFVFDWFSNVGQCIGELTAFVGKDVLDSGHSYSIRFTGQCVNKPFFGEFVNKEALGEVSTTRYLRYGGVWTIPQIRFSLPDKGQLTKLLSGLALLKQVSH